MLDRAFVLVQLGRVSEAAAVAAGAGHLAESLPAPNRSEALAVEVVTHALAGLPWSRERLAEALALEDVRRPVPPYLRATGIAVMIAIFDDDHHLAEQYLSPLEELGATAGPAGEANWIATWLIYVRFRLGTLLATGAGSSSVIPTWITEPMEYVAQIIMGLQPLSSFVEFMMNATLGPQSSVTIVLTMLSGLMVAEGRHDELIEVGAPIFWAIRNSGPVESMLLTWGTDLAEAYLGRADSASAGEILDSMTGLVAHLPCRTGHSGHGSRRLASADRPQGFASRCEKETA